MIAPAFRLKADGAGFDAKQARFAMYRTLNRVAKDVQSEQRAGQRQRFTVRESTFVDRLVKIGPGDWATRDRLRAIVRIEGPRGAEDRKNVLYRHEEGGPVAGTRFMPTAALRPSFAAKIPRALYPAALRLVTRRTADGFLAPTMKRRRDGSVVVLGKRRTWIVIDRAGKVGPVLQRGNGVGGLLNDRGKRRRAASRVKTGRDDVRALWYPLARVSVLRPRLEFGLTASRIYADRMDRVFREEYDHALTTAYPPRR